MINTSVYDCSVISLPKIHNVSGNITPVSGSTDLPFEIKRVYYLYDVPGGEVRGGHAHRELQQLIVAASGSFDVVIDDGENKQIKNLNRPNQGLLIVPGIWRELVNFSSGSICLVLASHLYNEHDYIRDYKEFLSIK
jgi:dTDP-4-dehydrorhamnose 3,5-epimerase-like enzyme